MSPVFVRRASGATIEDICGNQLLDFTGGIGCQNAGYSRPAVVAAIRAHCEQFLHTCFMVPPYEGYVQLAEEMNRRDPGNFPKKTFFVNSGAEAVENAVKIAHHQMELIFGPWICGWTRGQRVPASAQSVSCDWVDSPKR